MKSDMEQLKGRIVQLLKYVSLWQSVVLMDNFVHRQE